MSKGYIKLFRQIQDCWIWETGKFDKRSAWIDLLMLANHSEKKIVFNGEYISIGKGQYLTSIRKLADRWGWSTSTVSEFLSLLEQDLMIKKESDPFRTLLTIVNYEVYQDSPNTKRTDSDTPTNTPTTTPAETNNTLNTLNNKRKDVSKDTSKRKFVPPTVDEVVAYCQERENYVDPETFINFYESKGWMVGSNKMKDWKACVRTWENKDKQRGKVPKQPNMDKSKAKEWGYQIYDESQMLVAPYYGFPKEWFEGEELIKERVKPIIWSKPIPSGEREIDVSAEDLIAEYESRRRVANGKSNIYGYSGGNKND